MAGSVAGGRSMSVVMSPDMDDDASTSWEHQRQWPRFWTCEAEGVRKCLRLSASSYPCRS